MNINSQYDAMQLFVDTLNKIENVDQKHGLHPHVFAVYRSYCNLSSEVREKKSFSDFVTEIALQIENDITTLETLTRFKVPNKAASVCPIIPGMTIARATIFFLGLMPAAAKYRRDCKTAVRKGMSSLETLFGLDTTDPTIIPETELQLAEAV